MTMVVSALGVQMTNGGQRSAPAKDASYPLERGKLDGDRLINVG
jgi:hypothetical protein